MAEQNLRLIYPPSLINVPVIHQLIKRYDLTVNIFRAQITPEHGWLDLQISGNPTLVDEAITWLKEQGIDVINLNNA